MKRLAAIALLAAWSGSMSPGTAAADLKVMTRNLYLGASLDRALDAESLLQIPGIAAATWAAVQEANFPERAGVLAAEIAAAQPHLIGLQEVCTYRTQTPGDFLFGNPHPATEVAMDYLALLHSELQARGLDYRVAAVTRGTDVEVPISTGVDVRLTNRDVILARNDVDITNSQGGNYAASLEVPIAGGAGFSVRFLRGWAAVDAMVEGEMIRFVSTHLERATAPTIQVLQAGELRQIVKRSPHPVVLVGDFNSRADASGTASYSLFAERGFVDAWSQANPGAAGYTCCQADDLSNPVTRLDQRIAHVFTRGPFTARAALIMGGGLTGRTISGLWPSDHAGVVVRLQMGAVDAAAKERTVDIGTRKERVAGIPF